jgi:hypothetical protein
MLHADIPTRAEVANLLAVAHPHCVTIYLPTHRVTESTDVDRLLLRELTGRAVADLRAAGADDSTVGNIEEPLMHLVDEDDEFWVEQADSLAIFVRPGHFETHRLPNALPASAVVGDGFFLTPLLRAITFPRAAWVLAVAQGGVRLLEVGPSAPPVPVPVDGLPRDARQSEGNKVVRAREAAYARKIDTALRPVLNGSELPLILAASQPMAAIYRTACTYPHLAESRIHGSPDSATDAELADEAQSILDDIYAEELDQLTRLFDARRSEGRTANDPVDLARLANLGAVDTLFVDLDAAVPGTDASDASAAEAITTLDGIVRQVLATGGRVLAVRGADVPGGTSAAALLRFVV